MATIKLKFAEMPKDYAGLVAIYPPRPLHTKADEQKVEEIVHTMAGQDLTPDQEDYLDLLSDLLLKYESKPRVSGRRSPRTS